MADNNALSDFMEKIFGNDGFMSKITPSLLAIAAIFGVGYYFVNKAVGNPNNYASVNSAHLTPVPTATQVPTPMSPELLAEGNIDACMQSAQAQLGLYGAQ